MQPKCCVLTWRADRKNCSGLKLDCVSPSVQGGQVQCRSALCASNDSSVAASESQLPANLQMQRALRLSPFEHRDLIA